MVSISMKTIRDNIPAIIFWSVAAFILLWYIGARGLWGAENRWAEIVREMRLTGEHDGYYSGGHLVLDSSGPSGFCDVSRLLPDYVCRFSPEGIDRARGADIDWCIDGVD